MNPDRGALHLAVLDAAITALPPAFRRRLMVTCDGAGASHGLIARLDALAARPGYQVIYSAGWELGAREKAAITAVPAVARDPRWEEYTICTAVAPGGVFTVRTYGTRQPCGHPAKDP